MLSLGTTKWSMPTTPLRRVRSADIDAVKVIDGDYSKSWMTHRSGTSDKHDEAVKGLISGASKGTAMAESLDRLSAFNVKMGDQLSSEVAASSKSTFMAMIIVVCVSVVASIILGFVPTRLMHDR